MVSALQNNGFAIDQAYETTADPITAPTPNVSKVKFKDAFEEYATLKESQSMFDIAGQFRMERIAFDKPFVKEAYEKLGADEVRKLEYKVREIKKAITVRSKANEDVKIVKLVNAKIRKQEPVPVKKVKEVLQEIYTALGIDEKAKTSDLAK